MRLILLLLLVASSQCLATQTQTKREIDIAINSITYGQVGIDDPTYRYHVDCHLFNPSSVTQTGTIEGFAIGNTDPNPGKNQATRKPLEQYGYSLTAKDMTAVAKYTFSLNSNESFVFKYENGASWGSTDTKKIPRALHITVNEMTGHLIGQCSVICYNGAGTVVFQAGTPILFANGHPF